MAERQPSENEERARQEEGLQSPREDARHGTLNIGTGLGGGLAPVLPTDVDGQHPDSDWLASSDDNTQMPNWIAAEEVEPGLERLESEREPLRVDSDTHLVSVFGEDLGRIEEVYGYAPSNDPAWAAIRDGDRKIPVPLMSAQLEDDGLHVPYPKNLIESAPPLPERELSVADEMAIYSHYNERRILPAPDSYTQDSERTLHIIQAAA
jgi:hypothetical protein